MQDHYCRYCNLFLFSGIAREGKIRITCRRCKRSQMVDLATKTLSPTHLQAAGL